MASKRTAPSAPSSFECFNMNCYRTFPTEKSLRAHLWHSDSCKKYTMLLDFKTLRDRPYASYRETADGTQRRSRYGVESMHLNPTMSTNAPLFCPHDKFDYNTFYAGNDKNEGNVAANADEVLVMDEDKSVEKLHEAAAGFDGSFSSPAIRASMDLASITAMQYDVKHQCIVNLLKILEDA